MTIWPVVWRYMLNKSPLTVKVKNFVSSHLETITFVSPFHFLHHKIAILFNLNISTNLISSLLVFQLNASKQLFFRCMMTYYFFPSFIIHWIFFFFLFHFCRNYFLLNWFYLSNFFSVEKQFNPFFWISK